MHPILVTFGWFEVPAYGFCLGIGFVAGALLAMPRAVRRGIPAGRIADYTLLALASAVVCGRLAYVLAHPERFASDWTAAFRPWSAPGITMYGAAVPAVLAGMWAFRHWGFDPWSAADAIGPGAALGMAITRVGCFLSGCCVGTPSSVPWSVRFPGDHVDRHPTQLYLAAFGLGLCLLLLRLDRRARPPGRLFLLFLMLYTPAALVLDGLRAWDHAAHIVPGVPLVLNQLVAAGILAFATVRWHAAATRA